MSNKSSAHACILNPLLAFNEQGGETVIEISSSALLSNTFYAQKSNEQAYRGRYKGVMTEECSARTAVTIIALAVKGKDAIKAIRRSNASASNRDTSTINTNPERVRSDEEILQIRDSIGQPPDANPILDEGNPCLKAASIPSPASAIFSV